MQTLRVTHFAIAQITLHNWYNVENSFLFNMVQSFLRLLLIQIATDDLKIFLIQHFNSILTKCKHSHSDKLPFNTVLPSTMQKTEQYWARKQGQQNWAESANLKIKGCVVYWMQKSSDRTENFGLIVSFFKIIECLF